MVRKTYQGEKNDKSKTMSKLIQAVGIVLAAKGYTGLTPTNISKAAGVDRKLISAYFGHIDHLIATYIKTKDYWIVASDRADELITTQAQTSSRHLLEHMLLDQIVQFSANEEMQKLILWQLSERSEIMSQVSQTRDDVCALFFPYADEELKDKDVDLRAVTSLLIAGIYYLVLHTKTTNSTFCEINLAQEEGMNRIKEAIKFILKKTYGNE
jgi:AcrR family transcriptional regulator